MTTLRDDMLDDLGIFFDTDDLAVAGTIGPSGGPATPTTGRLRRQYQAIEGVEGYQLTWRCPTSELVGVKPGWILTSGGIAYKVLGPPMDHLDGITTTLYLTED